MDGETNEKGDDGGGFESRFCGNTSAASTTLLRRVAVKHEQKKNLECLKASESDQDEKNPLKNVPERRKRHQCPVCRATLSTACNLQSHIRTVHENRRDFECTICNKSFARKSDRADNL